MNISDKPPQQQQGGGGRPGYTFTSPYPQPEYDYPTAHQRTRSSGSLQSIIPNLKRDKGNHGPPPPSPTPSELEEMEQSFIGKKYFTLEFYKRPKVILVVFILILFTVFTALITIYHKQIEGVLKPAAQWMQGLKFGWLIPIAVLFIISFPPLFGHEIVAVLCGNVWGLWPGFGIVCAGTVLGEIGNFYAFKYLCQNRSDKSEQTSWWYACLASVVRRGGFRIAVMARLSVIPGHFTTAIFATCGMNIIVFTIAAILSMPKQFFTVYLGVLLEQSSDPNAKPDTKSRIISDVVLVASVLVTGLAMWYILHHMKKARLTVVRERRERARANKMALGGGGGLEGAGASMGDMSRAPLTSGINDSTSSLVSNDVFNPGASAYELAAAPMGGKGHGFDVAAPQPQRWDTHGRAVGYDDPYAYNSYPPPSTSPHPPRSNRQQTREQEDPYSPPLVNPHPYANPFTPPSTTPSTAQPRPPKVHVHAPSSDSGHGFNSENEPGSPFADLHAIPPPNTAMYPDPSPRQQQQQPTIQPVTAPVTMTRYALQDRAPPPREREQGGHAAEPTDASFYSAHSKFGTDDSI